MRVSAFVHLTRTLISRNPTGVAKHLINMVPLLARVPEVDLTVLTPQEDLTAEKTITSDSPLSGLPIAPITWSRRWVETCWSLLNWPPAERWSGPTDWVYCPADAYVATRQAKLAVTIHCVNWFERELPWYDHADVRADRRRFAPRLRRYRKHAQLILPVSNFLASRLTALFDIDPAKMRVVGNGVEQAFFQNHSFPEQWRSVVEGRPYVVVVGGLTRRKGGDCVLAVAKHLHQQNREMLVLIAGTHEQMFESPAKELSNIRSLGYVGVDTGLPGLLAHSVALLFPSRYETFGIPAAEAMAAGTPAVVAHYAALPEVVGDAGVVVDPSDPAAIAAVLDELARNHGLRDRHVEAGRKQAQLHRWERCVERVVAAFHEFGEP